MNEILQKAAEIIASRAALTNPDGAMPYCVLAQLDLDGYPTASPITAAKADGIREITFCTGLESNKAKRIERSTSASVCFCAEEYNITLVGDIEIITDPAMKKDMWYDGLRHHFSGPEDPAYCVLRFHTRRYRVFIDWQETEGTL